MTEEKVTIRFLPKAWQKARLYPVKCSTEVWGVLIGEIKDGAPVIEDIRLFKHIQSSSAFTESDPMDQVKFFKENEDVIEKILGWYHTHPNFAPYPSATDNKMIERLSNEYTVSIISSSINGGKMYGQIDIFSPVRMCLKDVKLEPSFDWDTKVTKSIEEEIEEKVKPFTPVSRFDDGVGFGDRRGPRYGSYGGRSYFGARVQKTTWVDRDAQRNLSFENEDPEENESGDDGFFRSLRNPTDSGIDNHEPVTKKPIDPEVQRAIDNLNFDREIE